MLIKLFPLAALPSFLVPNPDPAVYFFDPHFFLSLFLLSMS